MFVFVCTLVLGAAIGWVVAKYAIMYEFMRAKLEAAAAKPAVVEKSKAADDTTTTTTTKAVGKDTQTQKKKEAESVQAPVSKKEKKSILPLPDKNVMRAAVMRCGYSGCSCLHTGFCRTAGCDCLSNAMRFHPNRGGVGATPVAIPGSFNVFKRW